MSSQAAELARRMPFSSPMVSNNNSSTTKSSTSSVRSRDDPKDERVKIVEGKLQGLQEVRSGIPSLNLITDFPATTQNSVHSHSKPSILERRKHSRKISETPTIMNPQSALSMSDGTLVIGICLPSGQYIDRKSAAPEIVISPAPLLHDPWKAGKNWRPRSSMYSQATRISRVKANVVDIPPVPKLPRDDITPDRTRPLSATSWHTDFDEDVNRDDIRRRYSGESQLGIVRNMSVHTTRRASDGWWNALVSPIFGRGNTPTRQDFPSLPVQTKKNDAGPDNLLKVSTIPNENDKARRSSIWTDLSRLDAQRQTLAFLDNSATETRSETNALNEKNITPEIVQESGFGLASEYYEATWHDAYSVTPFFKCQGHDCAQKVAYRPGKTIGGPDAVYELDGLTAKNLATLTAQSASVQRSVHSARELNTGNTARSGSPKLVHMRKDSDGTEIDEEPDAQSEYHGSRSMLSSHANSPLLELQKQFKDYETPPTPKLVSGKKLGTPTASVASPAKALRVMGLERGLHTPERKGGKEALQSEKRERLDSPQRKDRNVLRKLPPVNILEDPFKDPDHDDAPEVLTPALREQFNRHNAIPMEKQASRTQTPVANQHDPLNISAPRKAPTPPRLGSIASSQSSFAPEKDSAPRVAMYGLPGTRLVHDESAANNYNFDKNLFSKPSDDYQKPVAFAPPPRQPTSLSKSENQKEFKSKNRSCSLFACIKRHPGKQQKSKRRWYWIIGSALISMVILIVVLVLLLTIHRNDVPAQSSMLTVPGFPPIPTGISTIAQPVAAIEESRCVAPNTLWSCALPKEEQASIAPNSPDQPNFRLEIRFQNDSSIVNSSGNITSRSVTNAVSAGVFMRRMLKARDSFTSALFSPSPSPPSQDDQLFLGKTTDNNTAPFQGESTPFFISFLSTAATNSKRALAAKDNTDPFPNVTALIPPPSVNSDGTAAAANLVPFPTAQPLMLYNRGRNDEHYGFYTYFDRSIFLKSTDLLNSTGPDIPDNANGGSTESAADVRCTWAQTRFLVQIWTNSGNGLQLLNSTNSTSSSVSSSSSSSNTNSATNFVQPGSFPYPVSITTDRHGGDIHQKMVYCYGMDLQGHIISTAKQVHLELRSFGGPGLINPSGGLFSGPVNVSLADGGPGGIDGGFGGCKCQWRNWVQI